MNFNEFAQKEYRNHQAFSALAKIESNPDFKLVLEQLAEFEQGHYRFWQELANAVAPGLRSWQLKLLLLSRKLFGLTFTVKFLEMMEGDMVERAREYLFSNDHPERKQIEEIIYIEEPQEEKLIRQIKEERVEFTGSIVLGLNDGLIELSGALTGFLFAFRDHLTVALAGVILGISASLSMAASAYLQARQERGKSPAKAALYTGLAYLVVVVLLVAPFGLFRDNLTSLVAMIITVLAIVLGLSFYTAVIFSRNFYRSFSEMLLFSVGTAFVTFLIGSAARALFGIEV
ncbi:MAG TPA: VIT1/CCC1 transporter family protein [Candidatus Saccharimonadales bacterium]|nr:VIT1/CCC1 transporter family protein [Candidatus Saccharimonadales bacterium]